LRATSSKAPRCAVRTSEPLADFEGTCGNHRSITQGVARHVSLRVVVAGKEVVNVRARAFRAEPVSNPEGCEVCGRSVRLLLNPDGTYLSRIGP